MEITNVTPIISAQEGNFGGLKVFAAESNEC